MKIDESLILKLEQLARLQLSTAERTAIQGDLNRILEMVEKLEELNTEGIEPLTYVNEDVNVLREDAVRSQTERADALRNAPDQDGEYFRVPKVIPSKK
ncbi:Asp-tRNA(Asn)/Glu-tRNA(Gln) amidotransferase subunit GatC [Phaeodactylibacter sp.]|jgi:aspartyl-tRNA(Asn)/glutamyl-tRNA(Gln) amidotransferase subunit C|uniref:Asp-tRNA(Asn)/Glu-tRNA(Gln) amidotransferase subunit GatC n=1 Tax=Phaeodactylibacter sp. TaxID=1940289 RepID=UPI0025D9A420|nr:Asp-tRNA(Asn)/Glu-tRNA(Gln) amidotransferase subunit GatC [Phaeodactylibacter sp.]MCI4651206.1 Asp-tRNA(Asn)/Glu-tRNA(Gln) amidotransferase subunit GatC [Phaeodactylibacter sp.]MCI5093336.1 Asp-tRNA(Asn)/Glu-tRNA(Gln) amidotransferase subunit GatC [Phaeodactylibacter sp.]